MKKKGFTLVELIGVIILLGIISMILIPTVDTIVKKSKQKVYDKQIASLLNSLKLWNSDNKDIFVEDGIISLSLADLKEQGYVDYDIKNPKTGKCISNQLQFQVEKTNKKYSYSIVGNNLIDGEDEDCDALTRYPSIYLLGNNPFNLEVNNDYEEPGYVAKDVTGNILTSDVLTSNNINKSELGKYKVYYEIESDGLTKKKTRNVNVVDTTKPVLIIPDDGIIDESVATFDLLAGVSATDNYDTNVDINVISNLSLGVPGDYTINYIAKDSSGNRLRRTRKITIKTNSSSQTEWIYDYTGGAEEFTVPKTGVYKFELWGAQGGSAYKNEELNKAGYTSGNIRLVAGTKLYIYVGQKGDKERTIKFNGGGKGGLTNNVCTEPETFGPTTTGFSGGGATDIRLVNGSWNNINSLRSRIMVAAGSGGTAGANLYENGGEHSVAGGLTGFSGGYYTSHSYVGQNGKGATQITGGAAGVNHFSAGGTNNAGQFGIGGDSNSTSDRTGAGGGGGGYYGGGAGGSTLSSGFGQGGGGGSSYISGYTGCVAITSADSSSPKSGCTQGTTDNNCSIHYSNYSFTNAIIRNGNEIMPTKDGSNTMIGTTGNGYAKITYVGENNPEPLTPECLAKVSTKTNFEYKNSSQVYNVTCPGKYKIELWGASGANHSTYIGGKGAYTKGIIRFNEVTSLYIHTGQTGTNNATTYNGGGKGTGGGGGATDVRLLNTEALSAQGLNSRIMVAAGGGGSYDRGSNYGGGNGGNGGTLTGFNGESTNHTNGYGYGYGLGGTQITGGLLHWSGPSEMSEGDYVQFKGYGYTSCGYFGQGGTGAAYQGGGGSGYYGGGGSAHGGAGGGSSYISGYNGCVAITSVNDPSPKSGCTQGTTDISCSIHYSNHLFDDAIMKGGNEAIPTHDGLNTMIGNNGNGYASITYLGN